MDNSFEGFGVMYSKESGLLDTEDEGTYLPKRQELFNHRRRTTPRRLAYSI
jgi:hypothetical protein